MTAPVLRVIAGNPTEEELAALVVVLQSRTAPAPPDPPPATGWSAHWRRVRPPVHPRVGGWQASAWR